MSSRSDDLPAQLAVPAAPTEAHSPVTASVPILGIPIFAQGLAEAVRTLISTCTGDAPKLNRLITATSAHGLVYAKQNPAFATILQSAVINLPDGKPNEWVGRLKGHHELTQCRGADFFKQVMLQSAAHPIRHFLCGGAEGIPEHLAKVCREKFHNDSICGTCSPPFRTMTDDEFAELGKRIMSARADVVWIGMSTPKQETFAARLAEHVSVHYFVTVGAAFDFHSGKAKEAPRIFTRLGFEWLYRVCAEPKRLFWRYAEIVPLYILHNLMDLSRPNRPTGARVRKTALVSAPLPDAQTQAQSSEP
jgi:N-acetylglucosaminyldiphosphoundecaprenol N-acetyl-beta-D-mannosaminyltransferase